ncbi:MAG: hypothetical protein KAH24_04585, partial [Holophagae bacterium]|nr:hypothetical protein [Holophagae bacterium]
VMSDSGQDTTDEKIELAPNPYLAFGMKLGRDECFAAISSAFWTVVAKLLISLLGGSIALHIENMILAVVGPIAEKPALLASYIHGAWKEYRDTNPDERKPVNHYVRRVFKEGWPTLRADLLYHDPSYSIMLWMMLHAAPTAGPLTVALFSGISFAAAVALASTAEVLFVEAAYGRRHRWLRRAGFITKSYYEARFLLHPGSDPTLAPAAVLDHLQKEFGLEDRKTYTYRDVYLTENSLAIYNGRKPYLRFRQRLRKDGSVSKQAVQVMHTRAKEIREKAFTLYRAVATRKRKSGFDFPLDQPMPWTADEIPDAMVRRIVTRLQTGHSQRKVCFKRDVAIGSNDRLVSVDHFYEESPTHGGYWIEVKSRDDLDFIREITNHIAQKFPVHGTTRLKCEV